MGSNLAYLALTPADCGRGCEALTRADELWQRPGTRGKLAQLAINPSCGVKLTSLRGSDG